MGNKCDFHIYNTQKIPSIKFSFIHSFIKLKVWFEHHSLSLVITFTYYDKLTITISIIIG